MKTNWSSKQIIQNLCLHSIKIFLTLKPEKENTTTYRKCVAVKGDSLLAKLACMKMNSKSVALVLGHSIHVYGVNPELFLGNQKWLVHEMVHVQQYEKYGIVPFLFLYLLEWMKHGYRNNRYEREAREAVDQQNLVGIFEEYDFEIK